MNGSVHCLSVRLRHAFFLCSHHHIIMKSRVIIIARSDVHEKGRCQKSKLKLAEVKTQFSRVQTVTPEFTYGDGMMHKV